MQPGVRYTVFVLAGFVALVTGLFAWRITAPRPLTPAEVEQHGAFLYPQPRPLAPFTLHDDEGRAVGVDSLRGEWDLLFFGFASCPDICPTTLAVLRQAADNLRAQGYDGIRYWLVSVDPGRDSNERLRAYVEYFDPQFHAMTGEIAALNDFARQLNAVFVKVPDGQGGYSMDHSAHIAIVDPEARFAGFFRGPLQAAGVEKVMPHLTHFGR